MRLPADVRIGVIGTGWWATEHHLPALADHKATIVTAAADPDPDKLERTAYAFGIENTFRDHRELLDSGLVDGVIVATPHSTHYTIARDALDAGVHVFIEKPMTLRAAEATDLVQSADGAKLHLVVGYTFHYTRHAATARELIQSGAIGDLQLVAGTFSSVVASFFAGQPEDYRGVMFDFPITPPGRNSYSDPHLSGGGQGHTQVTHLMGMLLWATGLSVTDVFCFMDNHGLAVDLVDAATFRLEGGALGTLAATGNLRPGQRQHQGWIYYGSEGFLEQDMINGKLSLHRHNGDTEHFADLLEDEIYPAEAPAQGFADLIRGEGANFSPGSSAARVVAFLEAAYESATQGRKVSVGS